MWSTARTGRGDNVITAIAIHVAGCDADATGKSTKCKEFTHQSAIGGKDFDMRSTAFTSAGDNFTDAIAVDVANRDVDATGEVAVISKELGDQRAGDSVKDFDVWTAAHARSRHNV